MTKFILAIIHAIHMEHIISDVFLKKTKLLESPFQNSNFMNRSKGTFEFNLQN